ncbi:MAG TPA: helix-turn-helix domain-containing protein, partial [Acidimicrobiales bacterium]|nr:helix-turn-helix domain-containing protein [Acidimicrobiales bacterium]
MESELERRVRGVAALDQPLRRTLHQLVAERGGWVTRDEAASAAGVPRSVAAFHLDKLVEAGVLEVSYERPEGRTGPGAGRPAKRYRVHEDEVAASVPDRRYDLAGSLLVTAVAEAQRTGEPVGACLSAAAHAAGRAIGAEAHVAVEGAEGVDDRQGAVLSVLARHGYEPAVVGDE